ncbi:hypothetical protein [Listeria cornellensis]|uniref:RsbT co-antagonist protein RsbRD N-terminal domain-containing protein n=1 Tax=Listeria cornellensis FSL F6-0969 TaxID=1265820 RepID=W7C142_9LIST|nr:hypothetical protein [Listeria cornellensis]EUJ30920.1 hypothetical protein PCORN_07895 [Listeria cornellensis FSL F6-0969]
MSSVMRFLSDHTEEAVDYWISTYYVTSEEYQARKYTPGYIDAHRKETITLLKLALLNEESIPTNAKSMGEDRYDMQTSFKDALTSHMSFYRAMNEFLIIHYTKRTFFCVEEEFLDALLKLRKYEAASMEQLIAGYTMQEGLEAPTA